MNQTQRPHRGANHRPQTQTIFFVTMLEQGEIAKSNTPGEERKRRFCTRYAITKNEDNSKYKTWKIVSEFDSVKWSMVMHGWAFGWS